MSRQQPGDIECETCRHVAGLRAKGDVLQAYIHPLLPRSFTARQLLSELTPSERAVAVWFVAIGNCLKREMAPHPKCKSCSILLGAGHLEPGTEGYCGTCWLAQATVIASNGGDALERVTFGRRGWLRDEDR